ncbi:MAG: response regulator transcription factor [Clostridia bacterium]|nr:response regulator transcription factor [Clostridia bacterium]
MENKNSSKKILVVEDDKDVSQALTAVLKTAGYDADTAACAEDALCALSCTSYALVLIDISLPKCDGFSLCREVRKSLAVPIIMLGAKADENEEVLAFELGADDYMLKPVCARVLAARVKARISRTCTELKNGKPPCEAGNIIVIRELVIDTKNYKVTKKNKEIELSKKEYEVLLHLALHVGSLMSREDLLTKVWGYDGFLGDVRTVDVTMSRLRSKIEDNPGEPEYIFTKRSKGYYIPA